jgi:putative intracellular protease/amidase
MPPKLVQHPRYRIIKPLGAGGMGTVYQAEHRLIQRLVALKVISRDLMSNPQAVERFRLEVQAAGRLKHPNIVTVHDAEQTGDLHFFVMEYVEGVSLARRVEKTGPLPVTHACHYVRQAALGLQHAFEKGMVHRDIKPQNLMLTPQGQVKILDFGLARLAKEHGASARPITAVGAVLGTPDYIAPEQARASHTADIRADIYSLGCTLYFLLAGQPPFPEGSGIEKVLSHLEGAPVPLAQLRKDLPPALLPVLARMMARDPAERYQTPVEAADALAPFTRATPAAPRTPAAAPPKRRPPRVLIAATAAVVVVTAGLLASAALRHAFTPPTAASAPPLQSPALPRVLVVLPHENFWYADWVGVRDTLEGKALVKVASSELGEAWSRDRHRQKVDLRLADVRPENCDAVVFVGGFADGKSAGEFIGDTPHAQTAHRLVTDMLRLGKHVGTICAGTQVLAETSSLPKLRAADCPFISADVKKQSHLDWDNKTPVVLSGQVVTGRDATVSKEFTLKLLEAIEQSRRGQGPK